MINPIVEIGQTITDKWLRAVFFTSYAVAIFGAIMLIMHVSLAREIIAIGMVSGMLSFGAAFLKLPKTFTNYLHLLIISSLSTGLALKILHMPYAGIILVVALVAMVMAFVKKVFEGQ